MCLLLVVILVIMILVIVIIIIMIMRIIVGVPPALPDARGGRLLGPVHDPRHQVPGVAWYYKNKRV